MAKTKENICSLDMEKDNDNSISAELSNQEERDKLLDEIAILKAHVSLLETMIETPKFGQLQFAKMSLMHRNEVARFHVPDVQTELCDELYRFAGLRCREFNRNSRYVFEITGTEQNGNDTKNNLYAIEIMIDESGCGKLGKWVLPMSVDVQEILSQYPIDNLNNVKHFLKSCKHHVDSYLCRLKQLKELQGLISDIKNIRISHTLGITLIELIISGIKYVDTDEFYNVMVYLYYKSTAARPYKLSSDTDNDERQSSILIKKLNKYFKPFLKKDLSLAFLQIYESQTIFVWQKVMANDNEDITEVSDTSDDGFLTKFLYRGDKKKSKNKVQNEDFTLDGNKTETSLYVEKEKYEDIDVTDNTARDDSLRKDGKIKSRKRKRLAKTVAKSRGTKKSQADSEKLKKRISSTKKENDQNKADIDYPISNVASGINSTLASTENVQMEDNYNRKNGSLNKATNKNKGNRKRSLNESNDTNNSVNFQTVKKRKPTTNQVKEKKKYISKLKNNKRAKVKTSTPFSKKVPKSYSFHEISPIKKED
ncbi:uncharacterized protein LOC112639499 [Camponotus floridanus]|uniref:uncharacterized protein LOC112639499 n=1 Tax=Camponotus floridanus TaxID=104421 RepID=UPI000DC67360|nr:uncharacterized protein LOC112639499 [Camponotus floridanus]